MHLVRFVDYFLASCTVHIACLSYVLGVMRSYLYGFTLTLIYSYYSFMQNHVISEIKYDMALFISLHATSGIKATYKISCAHKTF